MGLHFRAKTTVLAGTFLGGVVMLACTTVVVVPVTLLLLLGATSA